LVERIWVQWLGTTCRQHLLASFLDKCRDAREALAQAATALHSVCASSSVSCANAVQMAAATMPLLDVDVGQCVAHEVNGAMLPGCAEHLARRFL
jgi:hypothetical protein